MPASQLVTSVRAKFPGVYDDLTDEQLEQKVLAKYPGYRDLVSPPPPDTKPSTGSQLLRGGIATLPVMGGVLGGIAGSEVPVFGNAVGAGAGAALGEGLRQLIAQYALGDKPSPAGQVVTGLTAGGETAALNGLSSIVSGAGVKAAAGKLAEDIPVVRKFSPAIKAYQKAAAAEAGSSGVPQAPGAPRTMTRAAGTPALTKSLQKALEDVRARTVPSSTPAPPAGVSDEIRKSVGVPHGGSNGFVAVPDQVGPTEPLPTGRAAAVTGKSAKLADTSGGTDELEALQDAIHGGDAPTVGNGTLKTPSDRMRQALADSKGAPTLEEKIQELRREFGSDRIAKATGGTRTDVKFADASSALPAMPDVAQRALLDQLKGNSPVKSPSAMSRALSQLLREYKTNNGPANSSVAKELRDLMKSHGFDVGGE